MKKYLFITFTLLVFCAWAQDAKKITEILESERLTYGKASYLLQQAAGADFSELEALQAFQNQGVIKNEVSAADEIPLCEFALLCAKTWDIRGSIFLAAFKNGRYAFRQMRAEGAIPKSFDPNQKISGSQALNIVTQCIELYEGGGGVKND